MHQFVDQESGQERRQQMQQQNENQRPTRQDPGGDVIGECWSLVVRGRHSSEDSKSQGDVKKSTVSPLLPPVTSRKLWLLPSLPNSIAYRQANRRRRKDAHRVGTAARGISERLSRVPRRVPSNG